ncbi:hypothetical protein CHLRE_17g733208v5 [Chlamydomonas reinhardtii]|uniref:RRM domain-containing protein n=1 Tax=Chlamydomonas reinhardtii TaxID=3055 RepID=A0A2K3CR49_CHLRE|nr:uncharacterized protein CHLRE_17g733208v5 [Chlamydomonas reinhardtii]PNW70761.1 hypothetical protein CHLRE_17g733208v5 [Chlamydomonas reinhardtii]
MERGQKRPRSQTPPEVRMAREKDKELRELERATRTIFVFNLSLKAAERDLFQFFSKVGRVVDIRLITDKSSKKSRGLAYVEFARVEEVLAAVALTGQPLLGQAVMIKASEAEKNMAWEAAQQQKQCTQAAAEQLLASVVGGANATVLHSAHSAYNACWLNVSGLHPDLGDAEVSQLFAPFGQLRAAHVIRDVTGQNTGAAHLHYATTDAAARAMAHWHGRRLMECVLTVVAGSGPVAANATSAAGVLPGMVQQSGGLGAAVAPSAGAAAAVTSVQGAVITTGELDEDDEGGGIKMSAQGRVALMSRLAGSHGMRTPATHVTAAGLPAALPVPGQLTVDSTLLMKQGILGPSSPIATPCLLLKNMFEPAGQGAGPGELAALAAEVVADVRDEGSRFGELVHVWADARSRGFVYLRYSSTQAAEAAHRALHGRWYGGRQIVAEYQFAQVYNTHFKLSK